MAMGEFISVSSKRDSEQADIDKERVEQANGLRPSPAWCYVTNHHVTACCRQCCPDSDSTACAGGCGPQREARIGACSLASSTIMIYLQ